MKKTKSIYSLILLIIFLTISFIAILIYIFSSMQSKFLYSKAQLGADIVQESLTSHMHSATTDYQDRLLEQISLVDGVKNAWVVRSNEVVRQYGKGIYPQEPRDDIDRYVIKYGKIKTDSRFGIFSDSVYRISIPYAEKEVEKIDCKSCHDVKTDAVLGAVSFELDANDIKLFVNSSMIAIVTLALIIIAIASYMIVKLTSSYRKSLRDISDSLADVSSGSYSKIDNVFEQGESYRAVASVNNLIDELDYRLHSSLDKISRAIKSDISSSNPLIEIERCATLIYDIELFRNDIQSLLSVDELYEKLIAMLRVKWDMKDFNILEFNSITKATKLIHSEKTLLCDIYSGCSAKGEPIDSSCCDVACAKMIVPDISYVCDSFKISNDFEIIVSVVSDDKNDISKLQRAIRELSQYINSAKLQIYNLKVTNTTNIDTLTGLYTRSYLESLAKIIVAQSIKTYIPYGVMVVDIDQFSQINNSYNHEVGDEVIKAMARNIQECVGVADIITRYGSDTIAIILYDYELYDIMQVAQNIHESFKKKIRINRYAISKSVSIGIARFPEQSNSILESIEFAKRALLEVKNRGGNDSLVYNADTMPS